MLLYVLYRKAFFTSFILMVRNLAECDIGLINKFNLKMVNENVSIQYRMTSCVIISI